MILYLPRIMSPPPIFAVDFCVPWHRPLAAPCWDLPAMWNMHQVRLLALYKIVASDLFQQPKLTMILYLPQTMSPPPIFAVDFCVPGHGPLAARGQDLLAMQNMHQVRLLALYKIIASDLFQWPKLMMIWYLPQTMSLFPIWVIFSDMFPSSSKDNISPTTPCPYCPGCAMTLEQWQKSESNRISALTIKKAKVSQGAFQDPARQFGSSALPFESSSYAANTRVSVIC